MSLPYLSSLFLGLTVLLLHPQIYFGIRYRTWFYLFLMVTGMILQIIAFVAQVQSLCLVYYVTTATSPLFFMAAIRVCFAKAMGIFGYGEDRLHGMRFIVMDVMGLMMQLGGSIFCGRNIGVVVSILRIGLAWQLFSMLVFVALAGYSMWVVGSQQGKESSKHEELWGSEKLRWLLGGKS
jgi:hypothetical protein